MSTKQAIDSSTLISKQWVDIVALPPPDSDSLITWLTIISLSLVVSSLLIYLWRRRPVQIARRELKKLAKQINNQQIDNKKLLQQAEQILCHRFHVAQLSQAKFKSKAWAVYKLELTDACYQAQSPDQHQTRSLINSGRSFTRLSNRGVWV